MGLVLEQDPVDVFLAHYGVRGQKWGVRKSIFRGARKGDWKTRSKGQKAGLIAGGYVGASIGSSVVKKLLLRRVKTQEGMAALGLVQIGASIVGAKYGARITRNLLQTHGKKPLKQIRKLQRQPLSENESIRQVQDFLDKHPSGRM